MTRMDYTAENLEYAKASGRVYECDTSYIYIERAQAETATIELDGSYTAYDHGIEYFTGTIVPVYCTVLYGNNLKNKLERDVLTISAQDLTAAQKAQVQDNLGLSDLNNNIIYREATFTLEVGSNTNNFFYITDIVGAIPAGYKYLSIMPFVTGSDTANYAEFHYQGMSGSVDDSSLAIVFQNRASASRTWTIRLIVTYVRVSS